MSMEITGSYGSYATNYDMKNSAAGTKAQAAEEQKTDAADKTGGQKKSVREKTADYYNYLQKNFDCVREGKVAIDGIYLKACANDPEKAKQLEEDLAFFKESYADGLRNAKANARAHGDTLISYDETWSYDSKGNLTMIASATVTTDPGTKDSKELEKERQERLKEKKEKERAEEKKKEEKAEQKKFTERIQKAREENKIEVHTAQEAEGFYRPSIDVSV